MSSNARLDKRRAVLLRLANKAGYESWYKFETAVYNERVELPPNTPGPKRSKITKTKRSRK